MPNISQFAPTYEGHEFLGYFTKTCADCLRCKDCDENSICEKCMTCKKEKIYYTMKIVDDADKAYSHRMNHYWVEGICNTSNNKDIIWDIDHDVKLFARYKPYSCYLVYDCACPTLDNPYIGVDSVYVTHGVTTTVTPKTIEGYDFDHFEYGYDYFRDTATILTFSPKLLRNPEDGEVITKNYIYAIYTAKKCVAAGTLITLANGSQVPVESLKGDELLLVWNMITGRLDAARIMFVDTDKAATCKVINLGFSDGTTVKIISEHGFWDYDLNKFVYLRSDASIYIGHWFNKGDTRVQLTSVEVRDEYTAAYSPVTYGHLCYYVNGMLSMPGGIDGLFNIFEVNPNTMTINAEAMASDIATYGLFTYDEFVELVPVTEDVFNAFNGQYFKVAIGKGMITVEQLNNLASRYAEFFV